MLWTLGSMAVTYAIMAALPANRAAPAVFWVSLAIMSVRGRARLNAPPPRG